MSPDVARTPLHALHLRLGGRLVPFAGYALPVQYPAGLLKEHLHTRAEAGLFDVSHMGQIRLTPRSGDMADAARALETLLPIDVLGLAPGRQRYGLLLDASGGIRDDLMVSHWGDSYLLVVNAANKGADESYLLAYLSDVCTVSVLDRALLALQGPGAEAVLARLAPEVAAMRFMDVRALDLAGSPALVTRSGYTGEDGFEISVPEDRAEALAEALLADPAVLPIGLGARDSLRLEAGLCLHGSDIDSGTDPVEAGLSWAIPAVRRRGGARAGGFPGADRILEALETGPRQRRVGLRPDGPTPVRAGAPLFADETGPALGQVTSGGFGPSLGAPIAMGTLPSGLTAPGTRVFAEVRGKRLPLVVAALPFVPVGFKRA